MPVHGLWLVAYPATGVHLYIYRNWPVDDGKPKCAKNPKQEYQWLQKWLCNGPGWVTATVAKNTHTHTHIFIVERCFWWRLWTEEADGNSDHSDGGVDADPQPPPIGVYDHVAPDVDDKENQVSL